MLTTESEIEYASWNEWNPKDYLSEYYQDVMPDERHALEFLVDAMRKLPPVPLALDFGSGPTVHHLFPLALKTQEIHAAEYLAGNRSEIEAWLARDNTAHDWRAFSLETLRLEGNPLPTAGDAEAREEDTRRRLTHVYAADAGDTDPLGREKRGFYPLVTTHYCAEGATNDKETWRLYMRNIASLVSPGGTLLISACGAADFYCVGARRFPCAGVTASEVILCLEELGFRDLDLRVCSVPDHSEQGYSSVIFACAIKSRLSTSS